MITFPRVVSALFIARLPQLLHPHPASHGITSATLALLIACLIGNCSPATPTSPAPEQTNTSTPHNPHLPPADNPTIILHHLAEPTQPPTQAPDGAVTFVYYNLENYLHMPRTVNGTPTTNAPKPPREIAALVSIISQTQPDILAICEIGDQHDLHDLQRRLNANGVDLPHSEWMRAQGDNVRHLALLSRHPIIATNHATNLTYQANGQTLDFRRGIFDATLSIHPDFELRIVGVHLKAKLPVPYASEEEMRRNEAHLLRQHINSILSENPDTRLLVYGDLNDTRNSPAVRAVKGSPRGHPHTLLDIPLADKFGFRWTHYWQEADLYSRIDYAMTSPALNPHILKPQSHIHHAPEWFTASDHRPLIIYINPSPLP